MGEEYAPISRALNVSDRPQYLEVRIAGMVGAQAGAASNYLI